MHFIAFGLLRIASTFSNINFDLRDLLKIALLEGHNEQYADIFFSYLCYCTAVIIISFSAGHISRFVVRRLKLDRRIRLFRFSNEWHYLLSGEFLDFPEVPDHPEEVSFKLVNVLVSTGGQQIIYVGELIHFTLSDEGGLDNIVLKDAERRLIQDDQKEDRYYKIPGRYITIPYKTIININIRYFYLEEVTDDYDEENLL